MSLKCVNFLRNFCLYSRNYQNYDDKMVCRELSSSFSSTTEQIPVVVRSWRIIPSFSNSSSKPIESSFFYLTAIGARHVPYTIRTKYEACRYNQYSMGYTNSYSQYVEYSTTKIHNDGTIMRKSSLYITQIRKKALSLNHARTRRFQKAQLGSN